MSAIISRVLQRREAVLALVIAVVCVVVTLISPQFVSGTNVVNILTSNVVLAVLALGMAVVLVPAHIDVSVGAQLAVVAIVVSDLVIAVGEASVLVNPITMVILGVLMGAVLGALNGVLVSWVRLPAIIVTLGMSSILRGVLFATTKGTWSSGVPGWLSSLQVKGPLGVPWVLVILAVTVAALWFFMHRTTAGRNVMALGGNREAAARLGVKVGRVDMTVFVIMGALSGLAGVLYVIKMGSAQPGAAVGIEMSAIAAAILGGASVFGGRIHLAGTLLGVLLLGVIENALVLSGVPVYWQGLVSGLIVVTAVTAAVIQDRRAARAQRIAAMAPKEQ